MLKKVLKTAATSTLTVHLERKQKEGQQSCV